MTTIFTMSSPSMYLTNSIIAATPPLKDLPTRLGLPRRSSSLHKTLITKLRPLPFQYVWSVWYSRCNNATSTDTAETYTSQMTLLADTVPDIGTFYRIYNNFPWDQVRLRDSVYVFRAGVQPLWEHVENLEGGCWVIKVRREQGKAVRMWEEICLLGCGGELQAAVASERDHILGMAYSPRLYWAHISVWTKKGDNFRSVQLLEDTILTRISPDLQPKSKSEYYYKKHSQHEGWSEAVHGWK